MILKYQLQVTDFSLRLLRTLKSGEAGPGVSGGAKEGQGGRDPKDTKPRSDTGGARGPSKVRGGERKPNDDSPSDKGGDTGDVRGPKVGGAGGVRTPKQGSKGTRPSEPDRGTTTETTGIADIAKDFADEGITA